MKVYHTLKPIYDHNSQILILGSMPSAISRKEEFYYAHKQNRFWPILSSLFNVSLKTTKEKENFILNNKIALWDVLFSCDIKGSSDTTIKNIKYNDVNKILKVANIKCIFCVGKKAYDLFIKHYKGNIPIIYLPSPSSANAAFSLEKLIEKYKIILKYL